MKRNKKNKHRTIAATKAYWLSCNNGDADGCSDGLEDKETLWNTARVFNLQRTIIKLFYFKGCDSVAQSGRIQPQKCSWLWQCSTRSHCLCWEVPAALHCTAVFAYILTCLFSSIIYISLNFLLQARELIVFFFLLQGCLVKGTVLGNNSSGSWGAWQANSWRLMCWQRQWSVLVICSDSCLMKFCEKAQTTVLTEQLFIVKSKWSPSLAKTDDLFAHSR